MSASCMFESQVDKNTQSESFHDFNLINQVISNKKTFIY